MNRRCLVQVFSDEECFENYALVFRICLLINMFIFYTDLHINYAFWRLQTFANARLLLDESRSGYYANMYASDSRFDKKPHPISIMEFGTN